MEVAQKISVWDANRKIFVYPENWIEPDLRLPAACLVSLREVAASVRFQCGTQTQRMSNSKPACARGVRVLLTGKNRTRALVAAQTVASDLRLDLDRIDLSAVVSKYIGETEQNLRRIFDKAERAGAILLFDEAGALFGKRSEVKDSHDRYANIEANFLLQRMEQFGGLAILTANARRGLDAAFLRRMHFVIRVPC